MNKYTNKQETLRERKIASKHWILSKSFRFALIGVAAVLGICFLAQISSVSTKGFEISDLQEKKQELERETGKLEVEIAKFRSIGSIEERLANADMVIADEIEYISPIGSEVARR